MKGLTFLNDPWKLRTDQVFTLILMWKQDPLMRRCMDVNIVKKIEDYIKIDLSGVFKLIDNRLICFRYVCFTNIRLNYFGWCLFGDKKCCFQYHNGCKKCLRPSVYCTHYIVQPISDNIKNISVYRNRFEFDNPIIKQ